MIKHEQLSSPPPSLVSLSLSGCHSPPPNWTSNMFMSLPFCLCVLSIRHEHAVCLCLSLFLSPPHPAHLELWNCVGPCFFCVHFEINAQSLWNKVTQNHAITVHFKKENILMNWNVIVVIFPFFGLIISWIKIFSELPFACIQQLCTMHLILHSFL